jgi:hypothetical protein
VAHMPAQCDDQLPIGSVVIDDQDGSHGISVFGWTTA